TALRRRGAGRNRRRGEEDSLSPGRCWFRRSGRFERRRQKSHRSADEVGDGHGLAALLRLSWDGVIRREPGDPRRGLSTEVVLYADDAGPEEGVVKGADGALGVGLRSVELVVHLVHQPEGVVVVAEPDVQPVLLDTPVHAAAARPLAAEPSAPLVDGDALEVFTPTRPAQLPRRGEPRHPTPDNDDLARLGHGQSTRSITVGW